METSSDLICSPLNPDLDPIETGDIVIDDHEVAQDDDDDDALNGNDVIGTLGTDVIDNDVMDSDVIGNDIIGNDAVDNDVFGNDVVVGEGMLWNISWHVYHPFKAI